MTSIPKTTLRRSQYNSAIEYCEAVAQEAIARGISETSVKQVVAEGCASARLNADYLLCDDYVDAATDVIITMIEDAGYDIDEPDDTLIIHAKDEPAAA